MPRVSKRHLSRRGLLGTISAGLILASTGLAIAPMVAPVCATQTSHLFFPADAPIIEHAVSYPDQEFEWELHTYGTETWSYGYLLQTTCSVYGYHSYRECRLPAPDGTTITDWDYTVHVSRYGGHDVGTYVSDNVLVIRIESGGYYSGGTYYYGEFSATYRIYDNTQRTSALVSLQSGSGVVNASEGDKQVGTFSLVLPAEHGGTVEVDSRALAIDNPNVTGWFLCWATGSVYAKTEAMIISYDLRCGWNMVSVPVDLPDGANTVEAVFNEEVEAVCEWEADQKEYVEPDVLKPGCGYWVALAENTTIDVEGPFLSEWHESVATGWNVIGSIHEEMSVEDLTADVGDPLLTDAVYYWSPELDSYVVADEVSPGKGYLLASTEDCTASLGPPEP